MYNSRHIEHKIKEMTKYFKVVLLVGARQVGKSSLLEHLFPNVKSVVFDPLQDFYGVRKDPELFLNNFPSPLILDEIQYAPELLPAIKRRVDQNPAMGQYLMTGSHNIAMMKNVAESLVGRVGIVRIDGMTPYELKNNVTASPKTWVEHYLSNPDSLENIKQGSLPKDALFNMIWRGQLPGTLPLPEEQISSYMGSYITTYIERDVRLLEDIRDLAEFTRYVHLMAACTGQEINYAHLGREIGIHNRTAQKWLAVLAQSFQWQELWPYDGNTMKRVSKKRKGYFMDTGLICALQRISSPLALAGHPSLGALFETWGANMILSLCRQCGVNVQSYHWRVNNGSEVDLILEKDGVFYPIEFKCKTTLSKQDARGIRSFRETYPKLKIAPGLIFYAGLECYKVASDVLAYPWNKL